VPLLDRPPTSAKPHDIERQVVKQPKASAASCSCPDAILRGQPASKGLSKIMSVAPQHSPTFISSPSPASGANSRSTQYTSPTAS